MPTLVRRQQKHQHKGAKILLACSAELRIREIHLEASSRPHRALKTRPLDNLHFPTAVSLNIVEELISLILHRLC